METLRAAALALEYGFIAGGFIVVGLFGGRWLDQQFGTGPCGMLIQTGLPCPTCGMTTAFAHTVRGQWLRASWAQPAGFILALATIACAVVAGWVLVTGRWPVVSFMWLTPFRLFTALLILLLGGWGFKLITGLLDGSLPVGPVRL